MVIIGDSSALASVPQVNQRTVLRSSPAWQPDEAAALCRSRFVDAYPEIRRRCEPIETPGAALVAIGADGGVTHRIVRASGDCCRHLVAGRHTQCHVRLNGSHIALRQLVLLVPPVHSDEVPRLRLLDLRTGHPPQDERGCPQRGLETSGPVLLICGDSVLFLCPTGPASPMRWPRDSDAGWRALPPRAYADLLPDGHHPNLARRTSASGCADDRLAQTIVETRPGPAAIEQGVVGSLEGAAGKLTLIGSGRREVVLVGKRALEHGILFGRYSRCDVNSDSVLHDAAISRVHLMLLRLGHELWALDTASTFGTTSAGQPFVARRVGPGDTLDLAGGVSKIRWSFLA